nr:MAG TPA: PIN like domain [Caudoviricetes sp.]
MSRNSDSRCFCVDENISHVIAKALDKIYKQHRITSVVALELNGAKDTELIPELAQRGVHVLITQDRRQLLNKEETQALIDHGIHWAGFPLPDDPPKGTVPAYQAECVLTLIPYIIHHWENLPSAYLYVPQKKKQITVAALGSQGGW